MTYDQLYFLETGMYLDWSGGVPTVQYNTSNRLNEKSRIFRREFGTQSEKKSLGEVVGPDNGYKPIASLFNEDGPILNPGGSSYFTNQFDASVSFNNGQSDTDGIFRWDSTQRLYFMIRVDGDADRSWWFDDIRDARYYLYEIDTATELSEEGKITMFTFEGGEHTRRVTGGGSMSPAWQVDNFSFSINTLRSFADEDYNPEEIYHPITGSVLPPHSVNLDGNFNNHFLNATPYSQLESADYKYDYSPISKINVATSIIDVDLQTYYNTVRES